MAPMQSVDSSSHDTSASHGVHKLDSAMSVLTTLLVDLEHELRDHSGQPHAAAPASGASCYEPDMGGPLHSAATRSSGSISSSSGGAHAALAPPMAPRGAAPARGSTGSSSPLLASCPVAPPKRGDDSLGSTQNLPPAYGSVNARADKLDSALGVLTRQLAELERELRGNGAPRAPRGAPPEGPRSTRGERRGEDISVAVEAELEAVQAKVSALREISAMRSAESLAEERRPSPMKPPATKAAQQAASAAIAAAAQAAAHATAAVAAVPPEAWGAVPLPTACARYGAEVQRAGSASVAVGCAPELHGEEVDLSSSKGGASREEPPLTPPLGQEGRAAWPGSAPSMTPVLAVVAPPSVGTPRHSTPMPPHQVQHGTPMRGVGAAMRDPRRSMALTPKQLGAEAVGPEGRAAVTPPGAAYQRWQPGPARAGEAPQHLQCVTVSPVHVGGSSGARTPMGAPQGPCIGSPMDRFRRQPSMQPGCTPCPQPASSPPGREASTSPMRNGVATPAPNSYATGLGRKSPRQAAQMQAQTPQPLTPQQGYPLWQTTSQDAITPRMQPFPQGGFSRSPLRRPWGAAGAFGVCPTPPQPGVVVLARKSPSPVRRVSHRSGSALLPPGQGGERSAGEAPLRSAPPAVYSAPGPCGPGSSCVPPPAASASEGPPPPPRTWGARSPGSAGLSRHPAGSTSMSAAGARRTPAPGAGSPQPGLGPPGGMLPQRSPSRARPAGQHVAVRKQQDGSVSVVSAAFSPQAGSQPLTALPSRSASITSSNTSFYFTPQSGPPAAASSSGSSLPATSYAPEPGDHIDQMFAAALASLDPSCASKLLVRKLGPWRYEVDGRRVTCHWSNFGGGPQGLAVSEDEVRDSETPLTAYLSQAANVAASLTGHRADMPKIARIPKEQRLTFADGSAKDSTQALKLDDVGGERCESMRIACEQAFLREQAAEAYERSLRNPFTRSKASQPRALNPPAGLSVAYLN